VTEIKKWICEKVAGLGWGGWEWEVCVCGIYYIGLGFVKGIYV